MEGWRTSTDRRIHKWAMTSTASAQNPRAVLYLYLVSYAAATVGLGYADNRLAGLQHFESCEQCVAAGLVRMIVRWSKYVRICGVCVQRDVV